MDSIKPAVPSKCILALLPASQHFTVFFHSNAEFLLLPHTVKEQNGRRYLNLESWRRFNTSEVHTPAASNISDGSLDRYGAS